jgi:replicative DNA helicase
VIQADFERMANAAKRISNAPVFIENVSGQTISQIRAKARRLVQHHGVKLAVVDYMQLVTNPESDNREQEVSAISKGCKAIAMEHGIPVLALSQLNDDGKVRESRAISQDTDSLWVIKPQGDREPQIQPVHLVIEKCRDGEVGSVELTFIKKFTRFECASRITDSDVPARKDLA